MTYEQALDYLFDYSNSSIHLPDGNLLVLSDNPTHSWITLFVHNPDEIAELPDSLR